MNDKKQEENKIPRILKLTSKRPPIKSTPNSNKIKQKPKRIGGSCCG